MVWRAAEEQTATTPYPSHFTTSIITGWGGVGERQGHE